MNHHDLIDYWIPACESVYTDGLTPLPMNVRDRIDFYHRLDKDLDIREYHFYRVNPPQDDKPISADLRELLIKLAGPHGKTILKAYQIRKGIVHDH